MRSTTFITLAAACAASVAGAPVNEKRDYYYNSEGIPTTTKDPLGNTSIADPQYRAITDFDYASFNLGLYQEWIELDLFHYGLATFTDAEWDAIGVTAEYRSLLQFMANQETGHAQLLTDILGAGAAKQCTYNYTGAFDSPKSYLDFNQRLTRWGESGVWGFLSQLNSRDSAHLLSQSIATEARQQMIFRQLLGANAMDVYFEPGVPQAWQWTLLAPYIMSCPADNPRVEWSNFPALTVTNNPVLADHSAPDSVVSTNMTALVEGGEKFYFTWEEAGQAVGPNKSYTTTCSGKAPTGALFVNQLNASYAPITLTGSNAGYVSLPTGDVFDTAISHSGPAINGTGFVALVDNSNHYTVYNLSLVIPHMVAGPAIFQSG